tara:strand:- start:65 stop:700 length:636 start_codon:yes stop_codon:yes gene_type:complete
MHLSENTISEFHDNLMVYYDLAQKKQQEHSGPLVKTITKLAIPDFDIKATQDRTILRDYENGNPRDWGTKREWRDYMVSKGYNIENTKMLYVDHDDLPKTLLECLQTLPVRYPVFSLNIQPPGSVVPAHEDTWRIWYDKYPGEAKRFTFDDTVFYIAFLSVQEIGHSFMCGNKNIHWTVGDVVEMPYYCKHATANAGFTDKILVQCLGIRQ